MSDFALSPRSGLEHVLLPGTYGAHQDAPGVVVALRSDLALALVLTRNGKTEELLRRARDRFDVTLPMTAQRVEKNGLSFAWAGPGRWLAGASTQPPLTLQAMLRGELFGLASVANQTDGRSIFQISGPNARDALACGLPVDIDPRVFGPGDTALTLAGHINVHFWQLDAAPVYEFAVPRSFGVSFCEWLLAAAAKYGVLVHAV